MAGRPAKKANKSKRPKRAGTKKGTSKTARKKPARATANRKRSTGDSERATKRSEPRLGTFDNLIVPHTPQVQGIARRLREIVRDALPDAGETVYLGWRIALYRENAEICGIQPMRERCNFYLARGAEIPDPDGLLEGTGKAIRHVKVPSLAGLPVEAIRKLIREGRRLDRS